MGLFHTNFLGYLPAYIPISSPSDDKLDISAESDVVTLGGGGLTPSGLEIAKSISAASKLYWLIKKLKGEIVAPGFTTATEVVGETNPAVYQMRTKPGTWEVFDYEDTGSGGILWGGRFKPMRFYNCSTPGVFVEDEFIGYGIDRSHAFYAEAYDSIAASLAVYLASFASHSWPTGSGTEDAANVDIGGIIFRVEASAYNPGSGSEDADASTLTASIAVGTGAESTIDLLANSGPFEFWAS